MMAPITEVCRMWTFQIITVSINITISAHNKFSHTISVHSWCNFPLTVIELDGTQYVMRNDACASTGERTFPHIIVSINSTRLAHNRFSNTISAHDWCYFPLTVIEMVGTQYVIRNDPCASTGERTFPLITA